jgi:hypothetical protein
MGERQGLDLRQDRFVLAQGLQDDVAVRMILRFFGRQHAFLLHHVHDGLIIGQERELPSTKPIRATVPHLGNGQDAMSYMHHGQCRRHMARPSTGPVVLTDRFMGPVHSTHDLFCYGQGLLCHINERLGHDIDCQLAGNLPSFMATKAISHYQHSPTRANVMVEQLWTQLVLMYTDHFTGQIGHHEMVLVVVAL